MRAIAEPKYSSKIIASNNFRPVDNGERLYLNAVTMLRTITVGIDSTINLYVDYLSAGCKEGVLSDGDF